MRCNRGVRGALGQFAFAGVYCGDTTPASSMLGIGRKRSQREYCLVWRQTCLGFAGARLAGGGAGLHRKTVNRRGFKRLLGLAVDYSCDEFWDLTHADFFQGR